MRTLVRQGGGDEAPVGRKSQWTVSQMGEHYQQKRAVGGETRNIGEDARYAKYWTTELGTAPLDRLSPQELEDWGSERLMDILR